MQGPSTLAPSAIRAPGALLVLQKLLAVSSGGSWLARLAVVSYWMLGSPGRPVSMWYEHHHIQGLLGLAVCSLGLGSLLQAGKKMGDHRRFV